MRKQFRRNERIVVPKTFRHAENGPQLGERIQRLGAFGSHDSSEMHDLREVAGFKVFRA